MTTNWNEKVFLQNNPCPEGVAFCQERSFDWERIWVECERSDWLIWWLRRMRVLEKADWVRLAIACAERTLPLYEAKYPNDARPRQALEAAEAWLVYEEWVENRLLRNASLHRAIMNLRQARAEAKG